MSRLSTSFTFLSALFLATAAEASQFAYPMSGHITDTYWAKRYYGTHGGIDVAGDWQAPIHAARPGTVSFAGWANDGSGWLVIIDHENGYQTYYEHMAKRPLVKKGQKVTLDSQLGVQGATGNVTGAHLHFEVRLNGRTVPQPERLRTEFERGGEMQVSVDGLSDIHQEVRERVERERREREERERIERERREREERERIEREARELRERQERERIERERLAQEERERLEKERLDRERREREERERIAREERERKEREVAAEAGTLHEKLGKLHEAASAITAVANERTFGGWVGALFTGQLREEKQRLEAINTDMSESLNRASAVARQVAVRSHIADREAAIEKQRGAMKSIVAAIENDRHRDLFGTVVALFSGQIGRENTQLAMLRTAIGRLDAESRKLSNLEDRMNRDPEFDPLSSGALPINSRPVVRPGAAAGVGSR